MPSGRQHKGNKPESYKVSDKYNLWNYFSRRVFNGKYFIYLCYRTTSTGNFSGLGYSVTFNPCRPVNLTSITEEKFQDGTIPVLDTCNDTSLVRHALVNIECRFSSCECSHSTLYFQICLTVLVAERINIGSHESLNFETDDLGNVYLKSYSNGWLVFTIVNFTVNCLVNYTMTKNVFLQCPG